MRHSIAFAKPGPDGHRRVTVIPDKRSPLPDGTLAAILGRLPGGWSQLVEMGEAAGKLRAFDLRLDWSEPYGLWAGLVGGAFFALGSHGVDQLSVQRYLSARGLPEARRALWVSGLVVLAQFALFLLIGAGLWSFYRLHPPAVAFDRPDRVFARSKAIIGRKVQHCHPPRSVDVVDRILSDFREGRQTVAEFWINFQGRFVHIRYFAVRDRDERYLGTLEVTQDLTKVRALEGERRLLEYDAPTPAGVGQ